VREFRRIGQRSADMLRPKGGVARQDLFEAGALSEIVQNYGYRNPRPLRTDLTGAHIRRAAQEVLPSDHHSSLVYERMPPSNLQSR
jgi:hypothetical protein